MANETGESSASIERRSDVEGWARAKSAMEQGGVLHRPHRLNVFYVRDRRGEYVSGTRITRTGIRRLEGAGEIVLAGVDSYMLTPKEGT